jgi:hypothetical protein
MEPEKDPRRMNFVRSFVYGLPEPLPDRMPRPLLLFVLVLCALCGNAQTAPIPGKAPEEEKAKFDASSYGYMAPAQDAYQGAWNTSEAQQAAQLWRSLCEARPADVAAQLNWFRSERNARLGQNNGQLRDADKAELDAINERISTTAPGSFEQHLSDYYMQFPQRAAFTSLEKASAVDGARPELILPMLTRANANGDKAALDSWCKQLDARGELSPALAEVASDLLLSVGKDGILFTNGDMDGAPTLLLQRLRDTRRDVLVVDQRLLSDALYRGMIWKEAKAKGPVPAGGPAFAQALRTATPRPIHLALSLDRSWFDAFPQELCASGIAFALTLEQRWGQMKKTTAAGPLSRNYLLPGALLLQHFRTQGNEARASQLEHELRLMGQALGATQDLIKAGVLAH